jgi:hypothetical protein
MKKTSKEYRQYKELQAKFSITKSEFHQYYDDIRKSRKKSSRLKKSDTSIYLPKYSLSVANIKTRSDFTKRVSSVSNFLMPSYVKTKNKITRQHLYDELTKYYGYDANEIIYDLSLLSDTQYIQFFKDNEDLTAFMYYPKEEYLELIDESIEKFTSRLSTYETK